ncbi:MAG TPA: hypothetical protein VGX68_18680 [Thermoanaerobaculia bacterium]|jgi:hypothetical protein|nr:hypothetical protein [Thermoanaerobaculia bacterium]
MKKSLRYLVPLILGWVLCTGAAFAGGAELAFPSATQSAIESAAVMEALSSTQAKAAEATPMLDLELFTPAPQPAAICPRIGCVNEEYCRRDRDCTARPGGVCNLFCPTLGCCSYPSS